MKVATEKLGFRRQYLLAPERVEGLAGWSITDLGRHGWLYAHGELPVHCHKGDGRQAVLAGFAVDARNPALSSGEIVAAVLRGLQEGERLGAVTYFLGGRWVLFIDEGEQLLVLNDTCGLRPVFYGIGSANEQRWCASEPRLLERFAGAKQDEALLEEIKLAGVFEDREYWWPAPISGYVGVSRLLPNHCLRLPSGRVSRYWPEAPLRPLSVAQGVEVLAPLLVNQVRAMARQQPLAVTLTAGLDTRTVLAACKEVADSVWFHTWRLPKMRDSSADIAVPQRLMERLGLAVHILPCDGRADPAFAKLYGANNAFAHACWRDIAEGLCRNYPQERLSVKGSCSETGRCFYYHQGYPKGEMDVVRLARLQRGWAGSPATKRALDEWLPGGQEVEQRQGIKVLDLFYWEQRLGCWQASSQVEWDIAQETFCPFNNRSVLATLLSASEQARLADAVHLGLIQKLWPELLAEPINPKPLRKRISKWIKHTLRPPA